MDEGREGHAVRSLEIRLKDDTLCANCRWLTFYAACCHPSWYQQQSGSHPGDPCPKIPDGDVTPAWCPLLPGVRRIVAAMEAKE